MEMIKLGKVSKTGIVGLIENTSLDRKDRVFSLFEEIVIGKRRPTCQYSGRPPGPRGFLFYSILCFRSLCLGCELP